MPRKRIGAAADCFRLRLMHMDDTESPDLEWRDDILYRRPPRQDLPDESLWRVEAVSVDDEEDVTTLAVFDDPADAHEALSAAERDLAEMTAAQFEDLYFPADV